MKGTWSVVSCGPERSPALPVQGEPPRWTREMAIRLFFPCAVTGVLWLTSLNPVTTTQLLAALLLACVPWWSYREWQRNGRSSVPLFAFVAFMYWLFFALPLFWGDRSRPSAYLHEVLPDATILQGLLAGLLAVACLALGRFAGLGRRIRVPCIVDLPSDGRRLLYVRVVLAAGALLSVFPGLGYLSDSGARQVITDLQTTVPLLAYIILLRHWLRGYRSPIDAALLLAFVVLELVVGIGSGWLGSWLSVGIGSLAVYLGERRRLPIWPIVMVCVYVLFFQVGKKEFRQMYWYGAGASVGTLDRLSAWTSYSLTTWANVLQGQGSDGVVSLLQQSLGGRTNLLTQTAAVIESTPSSVPYQNGSTYSYLVAGLVPRFLWPDKPSANDANRFYQVAYGVTPPQSLNTVSISVGTPAEAFINFGWAGIVVVMFLLGVLFDVVEWSFLSRSSGGFLGALGITILLQFMTIESQLGVYLSGIVQRSLLAALVFLPMLELRRPGSLGARRFGAEAAAL